MRRKSSISGTVVSSQPCEGLPSKFFPPPRNWDRGPLSKEILLRASMTKMSPCFGAIFVQCWAYVRPRTACSFLAFTRPKRNTPFLGHVGEMLGLRWVYVCTYLWVPIFHLGSSRKTDPTKCQVSFGKLRFFGGLGGVRFIHFEGAKQSRKLPPPSLSASFTAVFCFYFADSGQAQNNDRKRSRTRLLGGFINLL